MGVRIDEIKADFETYAYRDKLDDETVKRYQQIIDDLPPVDLFDTKEGLILAGGYHRLEAHKQEGRATITATIHQGTVAEAKIFACKANAQHGLHMTRSERQRALMDFIKFSLLEDPLLSNVAITRNFGGASVKTVRRYRTKLEESGEIEVTTRRRGADGKTYDVNNIGDTGGTAWANAQAETTEQPENVAGVPNGTVQQDEENDDQGDLFQTEGSSDEEKPPDETESTSANAPVNQIETIPAVEAEPKSDIVVEYAGKRINTLDDLMKVKSPDEELMNQVYDFNIAVTKVGQLVDKLKKQPLSRVMQILFDHPRLVQTLDFQAGVADEITQYYKELIDEREKTPIIGCSNTMLPHSLTN